MAPGLQRNACLSCRQRKLKCDRQHPCANCIARSIECTEQLLPAPSRALKRPLPQEPDPATLSSILSRLDQIESYLGPAQDSRHVSVSLPIGNQLNTIRFNVPNSIPKTQEPSDKPIIGLMSSEDHMQATQYSVNDSFLRQALMHELSISISQDYKSQTTTKPRHIQLPPKWETLRLFGVYFRYLGQVQHIIYEPHARTLVDEAYDQVVNVSATTAPRGLALILSVIAFATILEPVNGDLATAIPILKERLGIFATYIRSSMDCLEQHRRRIDHTLESVQALILVGFGIYHIEAFSPRYRVLLAEAIAVSHSLGLHAVDLASASRGHQRVETDSVTQEMKRRVWWYLAATDWASSKAEGSSGVTYLVHPKLINTNLPKHINDDDLGKLDLNERPISEPTSMSYNLQRLKTAEVARCISDLMPHDPSEASCELILSLDAKLESLLCELPDFFKIEWKDSQETQRIDEAHPYIPLQRLLANLLINIVRCGLHFPYLSGRANKSLHAFSRQASLKAARAVLSSHRGMSMADMSHSADFMKIQGTIFHIFVGALVLAADICCNQQCGQDGETQYSELMAVLKQLDDVKGHSQMAARLLDVLTQLLIKYRIWSPSATISTYEEGVTPLHDVSLRDAELGIDDLEMVFPFDELWETFVERPSGFNVLDILEV
ncbi:uncharacterized protein F5Z01DRAFT_388308 [Emericellopsis atlantica]|uniref:Zn(2)-C6 fungal-type domain-containing protein n=1 Tax=Emericellopsis atlantica TaxID=2614577 RepID=A0A9P8CSJ9_9HYPO|nr:uncharacterized protein F5Z01DRAFT_388308 [Emericellopsis atlantica]KAG9257427.1 hypothetical protein F5Z01DRAFT_388308 [Emericellopsis atlantica]